MAQVQYTQHLPPDLFIHPEAESGFPCSGSGRKPGRECSGPGQAGQPALFRGPLDSDPLTRLLLWQGYPWGHAWHRAQVSVRLLVGGAFTPLPGPRAILTKQLPTRLQGG